ncbi:MAG: ABC transporter substrate-binding protein [Ardenticatenales bacterium]|nr:ABC transporter substrate-binding protein [Ardenticatenales bacterium]
MRGRTWRLVRFLVPILILLLALAACATAATPTPQPAKPPLTFAYDLWPGYYPVLIANEKGFFTEAGVQVNAIKPEDTDSMMTDFNAGKYDGIAIALGDIVGLTQINPDIRVIFISDESAGGDAVVASADIQEVEDLRGQRLSVNLGGFAELFVTTMLEEHGLTPNDVTLVDTDAAEVPGRLSSGDIQAGHTWEPYVAQAVDEGSHVLFTSAQTPGLIPDAIAFRGETVRERPEEVRAFVQGWFRAVDYWKANPEEGTALAAKALNIAPEEISLEGIRLLTLSDNQSLFQPGETTASLYHTAQLYVDFFARIGTIRTPPKLDELLDPSFLK